MSSYTYLYVRSVVSNMHSWVLNATLVHRLSPSGERPLCSHSSCFYSLHMRHVCWYVLLVVMYMNSVFLSVFSSVPSPSMWVIVPAKPWWSIETFGTLTPPKDDQKGRTTLASLWRLVRCACFYLCSLIISLCFCYPHSLNLDLPCIGLSLLDIYYAVFNSLPPAPNCIEWCTRCSEEPLL